MTGWLNSPNTALRLAVGIVAMQAVAAIFFVADAVGDYQEEGWTPHIAIETIIALALLAGVLLGALQARRLLADAQRSAEARAIASGALAALVQQRFAEWQLTPAQADVALFALKGFDTSEIAAMRGVASGTVRAQLTQIYAKAGVNSHAGLVGLFLEDLIDVVPRPSADV